MTARASGYALWAACNLYTRESSQRAQVEGLLREERLVAAYEILDLFLELLSQRLPVLEKAKCVQRRGTLGHPCVASRLRTRGAFAPHATRATSHAPLQRAARRDARGGHERPLHVCAHKP